MKLISASGPPHKLMVVGDFPTVNEYSNGSAFNGPSGSLLNSMLKPSGLKISDVFKTYYFKVPVTGWGSPVRKQKEEALENARKLDDWDSLMRMEISTVEPNAILAMGELALQHLTHERGIGKWRGSILPLRETFERPNCKVIPCLSTRDIYEQDQKPVVYTQWDISKAVRMSQTDEAFKFKELIWIPKSPLELYNWWQRAQYGEFLTLDIETHHGFVTCIGFCHDGEEGISIPLLIGQGMDYSTRGQMYKFINEVLRSPMPKVNQNIKYDWSVLEYFGFDISNIVGDTMLMAHTLYPELDKNLGFLNSIYTDMPFYKDEGRTYDPRKHSVERLLYYNARDCICTWKIWKAQQGDAEALRVKSFYFDKVHPSFFIYKQMDRRGIRVDNLQRKKLLDKYEPLYSEVCQTISLVAEERININSPKQVAHLLYDILKCPPKKKKSKTTGEVTLSTGEEDIEDLWINKVTDSGTIKILQNIVYARKLAKIISFLNAPVSMDSRMRTSYKIHGTETGRTSAGKSVEPYYEINERGRLVEIECGGSFQTIPKHGYAFGKERIGVDLRTIFVPSFGYCFIEGDQAQAEDRIVSVLATDWEAFDILNKKEFQRNQFGLKDDRHTLTAMQILSKNFEEITPDDRQEIGKKTRHSGNYDAGPEVLAIMTHFPRTMCEKLLRGFHSANPKIRGIFHEQIKAQIMQHRYLMSPYGRRRDFFGVVNEDMIKQAYATTPQATVSDHTKYAIMRPLAEKYPAPHAYPLVENHDSATFEVRIDMKDQFMEDFCKFCETPIDFLDCSLSRDYRLVIPGEVSWSENNWGEMQHL